MKKKVIIRTVVAYTDDLVERHILGELDKLKCHNSRLTAHIDKTAAWLHIKDISTWKSFDFYNYFCKKFREKYKREFRVKGSISRAYDRIDAFVSGNGIKKDAYKEFIDLAFSRYFNAVNIPVIGNLCSPSLYRKLMGTAATSMSVESLLELDQEIIAESNTLENEIRDNNIVFDPSVFE